MSAPVIRLTALLNTRLRYRDNGADALNLDIPCTADMGGTFPVVGAMFSAELMSASSKSEQTGMSELGTAE